MRLNIFAKPRYSLPLAAAGLIVILPWWAADLLHQYNNLSPIAHAVAQTPAAPAPPSAPASQPHPTLPDLTETADAKLLIEVSRRKAELDKRERDLETRTAQAQAAEQLAQQQISELQGLLKEVQAIAAQQFSAADADLELLVGLYSNMKPAQAAAVLGKLEAPKAAAILQRLDTRSAGPILAGMDPQAALAITVELEQRHAVFRR